MRGVERIEQVFRELKTTGAAAFMPYHAMGYPTRQQSLEVVAALARSRRGHHRIRHTPQRPPGRRADDSDGHLLRARWRHNRCRLPPDGARTA